MINIKIVKKSKKDSTCCMCGKPILAGSKCISAFGYDYDNLRVNEKVHVDKKCYVDWFTGIDMAEPEDYPELIA